MPKYLRIPLIIALILSPYWAGWLLTLTQPAASNGDVGVGLFVVAILGIPVIAVSGIIVSIFTRNKNASTTWSIVGYAVPALLVCCYEIIGTFS